MPWLAILAPELAVASLLDLDVLAFQEQGVKHDDGLLPFIQANPIGFTDRDCLPNIVAEEIQKRKWKHDWRNQLAFDDGAIEPISAETDGECANYFGVSVKNLHRRTPAVNCYIYLERVCRVSDGAESRPRTIELHWAGYPFPNALIGPGGERVFDAMMVRHKEPTVLHVLSYATASHYSPRLQGPGDFELTYAVISQNFPTIRKTFRAHVGWTVKEATLSAQESPGTGPTP